MALSTITLLMVLQLQKLNWLIQLHPYIYYKLVWKGYFHWVGTCYFPRKCFLLWV